MIEAGFCFVGCPLCVRRWRTVQGWLRITTRRSRRAVRRAGTAGLIRAATGTSSTWRRAPCSERNITLPRMEDNDSILVRPRPDQATGALLSLGRRAHRLWGARHLAVACLVPLTMAAMWSVLRQLKHRPNRSAGAGRRGAGGGRWWLLSAAALLAMGDQLLPLLHAARVRTRTGRSARIHHDGGATLQGGALRHRLAGARIQI
jgi:hypothetical protein